MTRRKLDTTRSYATVHGQGAGDTRYRQDGIPFDGAGYAIGDVPEPVAVSTAAVPIPEAVPIPVTMPIPQDLPLVEQETGVVEGVTFTETRPLDRYDELNAPKLQGLLKKRSGKGVKVGTDPEIMRNMLREMDRE